MAQQNEIERKYLAVNQQWRRQLPSEHRYAKVEDMQQGYVKSDTPVRLYVDYDATQLGDTKTGAAFLTLKARDKDNKPIHWTVPITDMVEAEALKRQLANTLLPAKADYRINVNTSQEEKHVIMRNAISPEQNTVRIRISKEVDTATGKPTGKICAFLALKTKSNRETGLINRQEFQYEIPVQWAQAMLGMVCEDTIEKRRYHLLHEGKHWSIDEFQDRKGRPLWVAEVELNNAQEKPALPPFVLKDSEVTSRAEFSSRKLAKLINDKSRNGFVELKNSIKEVVGSSVFGVLYGNNHSAGPHSRKVTIGG